MSRKESVKSEIDPPNTDEIETDFASPLKHSEKTDKRKYPIFLYNSTFIAVLTPLLLLPIIVIDGEGDIQADGSDVVYNSRDVARFGYTLLVMAVYWISECLPISLTALLPYVFYPLFGILNSSDVAKNYFKNTNFLLFGGLMIAIAIESSRLHKRLALGVLKLVGSSPRRLMLGFMFIGWFLSMWISNTAACAMTIPIALAVLEELRTEESVDENDLEIQGQQKDSGVENESYISDENEVEKTKVVVKKLDAPTFIEKGIILCVPYACSVGGTATLTGTAPNLVLSEYWNDKYPESPITLSYTEWLGYNFVNSMVMFIVVYAYLNLYFIGFKCKSDNVKEKAVTKMINKSWISLGGIRQEEILVLISFFALIILWFFRKPGFINGWVELFPQPGYISDGVPAVFIGILLFLIPAEKTGLFSFMNRFSSKINCGKFSDGPSRGVLNWELLNREMHWGVLLLIGGGYAMADGSDASGFSTWIAILLEQWVNGLDPWIIALVVSIVAALFTEICSNTAAASLFVPILSALAGQLCINPLYLMLPATLACSLSFMLPAATPPNAIAFGSGKVTVFDMIKSGVMANILGILVVNTLLNTWGEYYFDFSNDDFQDWAGGICPNATKILP